MGGGRARSRSARSCAVRRYRARPVPCPNRNFLAGGECRDVGGRDHRHGTSPLHATRTTRPLNQPSRSMMRFWRMAVAHDVKQVSHHASLRISSENWATWQRFILGRLRGRPPWSCGELCGATSARREPTARPLCGPKTLPMTGSCRPGHALRWRRSARLVPAAFAARRQGHSRGRLP